MTQTFTDPGDVCLTGQNPYMLLFAASGGPPTTSASFWRVDLSPAGPGHVLFLRSEITAGAIRVYADNGTLARYIQQEIYANNVVPFGQFADASLDVVDATFEHAGDARSSVTERVIAGTDEIELTWYDFLPPFKGATSADTANGRGHGHYALYVPARRIRLGINDVLALGEPKTSTRDGRETTSCALALAETWIRPTL